MFLLWGFPGWWDDLICVYFEGKHHLRKGDGGGAGAFVTVNTPSAELRGGGGRRGFVFDGRQAGSSWHPGKRAIWRVDTPTHLPVKNVDSPWYRAHRLASHVTAGLSLHPWSFHFIELRAIWLLLPRNGASYPTDTPPKYAAGIHLAEGWEWVGRGRWCVPKMRNWCSL